MLGAKYLGGGLGGQGYDGIIRLSLGVVERATSPQPRSVERDVAFAELPSFTTSNFIFQTTGLYQALTPTYDDMQLH